MVYGSHSTENSNGLNDFLTNNKLGTFFGITNEVFNEVWGNLTAKHGNSIAYISMEIGADLDVYNPIKKKLLDLGVTSSRNDQIQKFIKKILYGPEKIPNYGGGLGILAGDTLKSFADLKLPVIAISLLYRHGYFSQIVDSDLGQLSRSVSWTPEDTGSLYLLRNPLNQTEPLQIKIPFHNESEQATTILAQVWMKIETSSKLDYFIPELLLDFAIEGNPAVIQDTSRQLYNAASTLAKAVQRRLLGLGIQPVLHALGITSETYHLNEQHGVVVAMQLITEELQRVLGSRDIAMATDTQIIDAANTISRRLVYTIHTPVKAGHDRFDKALYAGISKKSCQRILDVLAIDNDNPHTYNFTNLAMRVNRSTNSVSRLHKDVTHKQFPDFVKKISAITNGVHHLTWISKARAELFDTIAELKNWQQDPGVFTRIGHLVNDPSLKTLIKTAWKHDTSLLIDYINEMLLDHRNKMTETWINPPNYYSSIIDENNKISPDVFTIGFARRFSTYKRADLIFADIDKLCEILIQHNWPITFLFAGKAHPADEPGKTVIKLILDYQEKLHRKSKGLANLIFIPNYDMKIAKLLVAGVHAWVNSPKRPLEASGTSGMKAAMNGVPNISIMDGWWVEGYHNGKTGWKFGHEGPVDLANLSESPEELLYDVDSASFYSLLPEVLDNFYNSSNSVFLDKGIQNLLLNIPIFNTHRMAAEYSARYKLTLPIDHKEKMNSFAQLYSSDNFPISIE